MKKFLVIVAVIGLAILLFAGSRSNNKTSETDQYLTPANTIHDVHGLAVDVADSSKVWIASHTGLHLLKDDKDLYLVGSGRDDYMGFSAHPTDPNTFFSSGHPSDMSGSIGFQKTTDGGRTWKKISNGVGGPVDLHAMAVSQVDPNIVYGWYRGNLQKSMDGGKNWQIVDSNLNAQIIYLTTDPQQKDKVYATTNAGLLVSQDQGKTWSQLSMSLVGDAIITAAVNPNNPQELLAYGQRSGLSKSADGGRNWSKIEAPWANSMVMYISYDKNRTGVIYAITQSIEIYKTSDGGQTWTKVR